MSLLDSSSDASLLAEMQGKRGWAGVVLGDVLPASLFDSNKFSETRWQELLLELAEFSDQHSWRCDATVGDATVGGGYAWRTTIEAPWRCTSS